MIRNYSAPIRHRNDVSLDVNRDNLLKQKIARFVVMLALPATFMAIALFAMADTFKASAQVIENDPEEPMIISTFQPGQVVPVNVMPVKVIGVNNRPSIFPVQGRLTSNFGYRRDPFNGSSDFHPGQDIAAPTGTPIMAPADGQVTFVGRKGGYGNFVVIDHGNGLVTRYAHLSSFQVSEKQMVRRGEVIGAVGSTGRSTGPHLHYEVMIGDQKVNPMDYMQPVLPSVAPSVVE